MTPRLSHILLTAGLAIGLLGAVVFGVDAYRQRRGSAAEIQSAIHVGEANAHAGQAQAIPDHSQALADAEADSARAWAEVRRLRRAVGTALPALPDPAISPQASGDAVAGLRAEQLLAADRELIDAQDRQIQGLKLALADEQKRSSEWQAAFEAERKARQAQEVATEAWKGAVKSAEWKGGLKGFAAGVALGYLAKGQR